MDLFGLGKKKSDSLKPLTERDIQGKLYGHIKISKGQVQDTLAGSAQRVKPSAPTIPPSSGFSPLSFSSAGVSSKPIDASADLFAKSEPVKSAVQEPVSQAQTKLASSPKQEKREPVFPQPARTGASLWEQVQAGFGKAFSAAVFLLKTFFAKVVELLAVLISGILRLIFSIDFKKPEVARTFSWIAGVAVLFTVFLGIHYLNQRREEAMKRPIIKKRIVKSAENPAQLNESKINQTQNIINQSQAADSKNLNSESKQPVIQNAVPANNGKSKTQNPENQVVKEQTSTGQLESSDNPNPLSFTAEQTLTAEAAPFVIQAATFATQQDAAKLLEKFRAEKFEGFVKGLNRTGGKTYYCVFIGRFRTRQAAEHRLLAFRKSPSAKPFQDAFVRSLSD